MYLQHAVIRIYPTINKYIMHLTQNEHQISVRNSDQFFTLYQYKLDKLHRKNLEIYKCKLTKRCKSLKHYPTFIETIIKEVNRGLKETI